LRIVVSCDLGTLGPGTGEPILYHWRWYYNVPGLALWAILALVLVVPRANRTREALLILLPVLLVNLVWLGAALLFQLTTSDDETFAMVVQSLVVGSAVLWLLGHMLANYTGWKAIVLALGVTLGMAVVGVFSVTDFSRRTISLPLLLSSLTPALVLGYVGAGWMSRRRYRPIRFLLLLAAWTVAFSAVGMPLWFLLQSAVTADWPTDTLLVLGVFLLAGAILGVCVFLISLSFVLVGLRSPLFRPRLFACLRLPPASDPADHVAVADIRKEG
jgi:MFS family permease